MSGAELTWMLIPALGTIGGGVAILMLPPVDDRWMDALLGFTGGIMLAAACFSLLVPALEAGTLGEVAAGFALGALAMAALDALVPHSHPRAAPSPGGRRPAGPPARGATLLLAALTIHNIPEGLAVGVAFAAGGMEAGIPVALAITLQNVPEGFVAAVPLLGGGLTRRQVAATGGATGLVEPPAALLGFLAVSAGAALLPYGLAFAAAAMIYVVVDELLPECFARGHQRAATLGLLAGFLLMMLLDAAWS